LEYRKLPDEYTRLPEEYSLASEYRVDTRDEYVVKRGTAVAERSSLHDHIKKVMMMPLAASITAVSVIFASYGTDPLAGGGISSNVSKTGKAAKAAKAAKAQVEAFCYDQGTARYVGDMVYGTVVHVTYAGSAYKCEETGPMGFMEACSWVEDKGGDPDSLTLVDSKYVEEVVHSENAIPVGDPDDPANIYWAGDNPTEMLVRHDYYMAYDSVKESVKVSYATACDTFPKLKNLMPSNHVELPGSGGVYADYEEYIIADRDRTIYSDPYVVENYGVVLYEDDSIYYDEKTNTLTLDNYTGDLLIFNLMGNGLTINLIGHNEVNFIQIWGFYYGGSVTITGDGSLTVNPYEDYPVGLSFRAEQSDSCLMIDGSVEFVSVKGSYAAIVLDATSSDKGIYYKEPLTMYGGAISKGDFVVDYNGNFGSDYAKVSDIMVTDGESGLPAREVEFVRKDE